MCSERFRRVIGALISTVTFYECWQVILVESFGGERQKRKGMERIGCGQQTGRGGGGRGVGEMTGFQ